MIKSFVKKFGNLLLYFFYRSRELMHGGKTKRFEDKPNEKLIVVGNGPSAGRLDYTYYQKEGYSFLCVNDFALKSELFNSLKPKYYCCIDDRMYLPEYLKNDKDVQGVYDALNSIDWDMTFICGANQNPPITNPHIKIVRVTFSKLNNSFEKYTTRRYLKNKACTGFQNVICCCLFYAISSHFSDILFVGVEFDMHKELIVEKNNDVYREYRHFYGVKRVNIIDDNQIKHGEIYKYFYYSYLTLYQFKLLSEYSKRIGVSVTNLTINSTVDSFKKEDPVEAK